MDDMCVWISWLLVLLERDLKTVPWDVEALLAKFEKL